MPDQTDRPHGALPQVRVHPVPAFAAFDLPALLAMLFERLRRPTPFRTNMGLMMLGDAVYDALLRDLDLPTPRRAPYPWPQVGWALRRRLPRLLGRRAPAWCTPDLAALCNEILVRLATHEPRPATLSARGMAVARVLDQALEVPENRFSRRYLWARFNNFHHRLQEPKPPITGATYLELGCGSMHPLGCCFF